MLLHIKSIVVIQKDLKLWQTQIGSAYRNKKKETYIKGQKLT